MIETLFMCFKEISFPEDLEKILFKFVGNSLKIVRACTEENSELLDKLPSDVFCRL